MYRLKDGCVLPEGFMPAKISSFVCISMTHLTSNHFAVFKFFIVILYLQKLLRLKCL